MAKIDMFLKKAVEIAASDIHISVSVPPMMRQYGQLKKFKFADLTAAQTKVLLYEILTPEQTAEFEEKWEIDFAYEIPEVARFRANAFMQRKGIDICFRVIRNTLGTFDYLGIPDVMRKVSENHQGLVLITGGAGTGKSTTLAALVDYINTTRAHHVLTVEDPIEYVHTIKKGAVNQRQLGAHTKSYAASLKAALRENPDVIMVGEMRDLETISLAISASETGHLVIGSMNTSSAHKTVDKIIDSYPSGQQNQIRAMLGESLKAVFTQRLLPRSDGVGMTLAYELLLGSIQLANLIKDGKTFQIPNLMQTGKNRGMRLMDDSLMDLLKEGKITPEVAIKNATNVKLFAQFAPQVAAELEGTVGQKPGAQPAAAQPSATGAPGARPAAPGTAPAARPGAPAAAQPGAPKPPVKPGTGR